LRVLVLVAERRPCMVDLDLTDQQYAALQAYKASDEDPDCIRTMPLPITKQRVLRF
jgi:hypothetical protein